MDLRGRLIRRILFLFNSVFSSFSSFISYMLLSAFSPVPYAAKRSSAGGGLSPRHPPLPSSYLPLSYSFAVHRLDAEKKGRRREERFFLSYTRFPASISTPFFVFARPCSEQPTADAVPPTHVHAASPPISLPTPYPLPRVNRGTVEHRRRIGKLNSNFLFLLPGSSEMQEIVPVFPTNVPAIDFSSLLF